MKFLRNTRLALGCMLALSICLNALTPGKRSAVQDLTKQIKAGKLGEPEARKKALALNIPAKEMNDFIVQDLIMTADAKGIVDIFDAELAAQEAPAPTPKTPQITTQPVKETVLALPKLTIESEETKVITKPTYEKHTIRKEILDLKAGLEQEVLSQFEQPSVMWKTKADKLHALREKYGLYKIKYSALIDNRDLNQAERMLLTDNIMRELLEPIAVKLAALEKEVKQEAQTKVQPPISLATIPALAQPEIPAKKTVETQASTQPTVTPQLLPVKVKGEFEEPLKDAVKQQRQLIQNLQNDLQKASSSLDLAEMQKQKDDLASVWIAISLNAKGRNPNYAFDTSEQALINEHGQQDKQIDALINQLREKKGKQPQAPISLATIPAAQPETSAKTSVGTQASTQPTVTPQLLPTVANKGKFEKELQNIILAESELIAKVKSDLAHYGPAKLNKGAIERKWNPLLKAFNKTENDMVREAYMPDATVIEKDLLGEHKENVQEYANLLAQIGTKPVAAQTQTTAGTAAATSQAIPGYIQVLISRYKDKNWDDQEFNKPAVLGKLVTNAMKINGTGVVEGDLVGMTAAQVKDQIKKDIDYSIWTAGRIAETYLRLLNTKVFLIGRFKNDLSVPVAVESALQTLLSKDTNTSVYVNDTNQRLNSDPSNKKYFVEILDSKEIKDKFLNPNVKVAEAIPVNPTRHQGPQATATASTPEAIIVEQYVGKTYAPAELKKYQDMVRAKGKSQDVFDEAAYRKKSNDDKEKEFEQAFIGTPNSIVVTADVGAGFEYALYGIALPKYYKAKQMLAIHNFPRGRELLENILKTELPNPSKTKVPIANYIQDFEKGISAPTTPQTTAGATTAISQPQADDIYKPLTTLQSQINKTIDTEIAALQKIFGEPRDFKPLPNQTITLDFKHIFGIYLSFPPVTSTLTLRGFHHDLQHEIQSKGIIAFDITRGKNNWGAYSATLSYNGQKIGSKNFFPAEWSRATVVRNIRQAYDNFAKSGASAEKQDDMFVIKGKNDGGNPITMVVDTNGKMVSAYPTYIAP